MPPFRRRDVLKSVLAWPIVTRLWPTGLVTAQAPAPVATVPAAEAYRKAFAWYDALKEADRERLRDWRTMPLGPDADALIESARSALAAFHQGASQKVCDWGFEVDLDVIGKIMQMPRLRTTDIALLRARRSAETGCFAEALDDIFDVLAYSRHQGATGIIICGLFQLSMETQAVDLLAGHLSRLPRPLLATLPARIAALPPLTAWMTAMDAELRYMKASMVKEKPATTPKQLEDLAVRVRRMMEILERPPGQDRQADLDAWQALARRENPDAADVLDAVQSARAAWERAQARRAMLDAAIVRLRDGEAAFLAIRDPYGSGPFACEPLGPGFVLRSALPQLEHMKHLKNELQVGSVAPRPVRL